MFETRLCSFVVKDLDTLIYLNGKDQINEIYKNSWNVYLFD